MSASSKRFDGPSPSIIITTPGGVGPSVIQRVPNSLRFVGNHGIKALFHQHRPNPYAAPAHGSGSASGQAAMGFGSPRRTAVANSGTSAKRSAASSPAQRRRLGTSSAASSPKRPGAKATEAGRAAKRNDGIEISGLIRCLRARRAAIDSDDDDVADDDDSEDDDHAAQDDNDDDDEDFEESETSSSTSSSTSQEDEAIEFLLASAQEAADARRARRRLNSRRAPSVSDEAVSEAGLYAAPARRAGKSSSTASSKQHASASQLAAQIAASLQASDEAAAAENSDSLRLLKPARGTVRLTVVLDLDETLVRLREGASYVRPLASRFFEVLKAIPGVEIVIWTCATEKYARKALQHIRGAVWNHIIARDARWYAEPAVKNMAWLGRDLDKCIMIDNCPVAVSANPDNCVVVQDIPECLPQVDQTLWHVARVIVEVAASGQPVSDALNQSSLVSTVAFQVSDGADEDSSDALLEIAVDDVGLSTPSSCSSPQFMPSDMAESCEMVTPTSAICPAFPSETASTGRRGKETAAEAAPQFIIARTLNYSIPSVRATYGSLEMPAKKMNNKSVNNHRASSS